MNVLIIRYKKSGKILEGGEQASSRNLNAINALVGADNVETLYLHDETRKRSPFDYLRGVWNFPRHYFFGLTPSKVSEIEHKARNFDLVWVDRSIFGIIAKRLKADGYPGIVVAFFHNVERLYFDAKLSPRLPFRGIVLRCADRNDDYCCRFADRVVALNSRDSQELLLRYGRQADALAPISFADRYRRDTYPSDLISSKPLCLFLGGYFAANNEGIEWFVRNVYPHVDIRLRIVGKGMEKLRGADWLSPDIELVPNAPEIEPHFLQADLMVLPIFKGSGMKVKTCESLMYGKNILATSEAWEGYDVDYSRAGGLCNTADEFIQRIRHLSSNPWPRHNEYCRTVFLEKYSEESTLSAFKKVLFGN